MPQRRLKSDALLVAHVQARAPWFPQGEPVDRECPDVEVRNGQGSTGVEVTQLVEASSPSQPGRPQLSALHRRVMADAGEHYARYDLPAADVFAYFQQGRIADPRTVALRLATFVAERVRSGIDCETFSRGEVAHELSVVRVSVNGESRWDTLGAGSVPSLTKAAIEGSLRAKEQRLEDYRRAFARNWLLMHTSVSYSGGMFYVPLEFDDWVFSSGFDGVALYDGNRGEVLRVALT